MNADPPPPPARAAQTDSLFFALYPDEAAAARLAELSARLRVEHSLKARTISPDRFHVTLHYLGAFAGIPADVVARACAVATGIALPPAEVTLHRVESFSGRRAKRPLVLSGNVGASLHALEHDLGAALEQAGLAVRHHPRFTPHVTLLYDETRVPPRPVAPVAWTAREFALVHSLPGKSRHEVLARWPLGS
jgi:2'-5' RNA ligase